MSYPDVKLTVSPGYRTIFLLSRAIQPTTACIFHHNHPFCLYVRCVPMPLAVCFIDHSRSGAGHMRSWRHARNNRRRVCNYACFHFSRNLLHQTLKRPTPLVQPIKTSFSSLRCIWSNCHVYISFPCAWKGLDPRWRCQNMYIVTGYV